MKRKKRALVLVMCVAATSVVAILLWCRPWQTSGNDTLAYEKNVTVGPMPGTDLNKRKQELQQIVDDSQIRFSVNATPVRERGKKSVNWMIENPASNGKLIVAEIVRRDTQELLYKSGAIRAGNYMASADLEADLPPGQYPCTAYFYAYRADTKKYVGKAGAQLILTIL